MVLGGLVAVVIGPWLSRRVIASQEHALITIAVGAVIGGAIAGFATRKRAHARRGSGESPRWIAGAGYAMRSSDGT
jgi:hypothetical protein